MCESHYVLAKLYYNDLDFVSQRTLAMFVGVVALHYFVDNGVPQLPQT